MEKLSISSSIISATGLTIFLRKKFNLSASSTCNLLKTGINHTYKIEDKGISFIYRIYTFAWKTKIEILEEIKYIDLLKENNISVSYAIKDNQNPNLQEIEAPEGLRYGVLFSFAKGSKVENLKKEKQFEIGKLLGRIHNISQGQKLDRVNYTWHYLLEDSLVKIKTILQKDSAEMHYLESIKEEILSSTMNESTHIRMGIVHLDIWSDNFHIDQKGEVTIFDFDFCGNGYLALDIAYYILQLINLEKDTDKCIEKINEFIKGYETVSKIPPEEKDILQRLGLSLYFFYLGVQCERFENWSNVFLNESYLKKYIHLIVKRFHHFEYWKSLNQKLDLKYEA